MTFKTRKIRERAPFKPLKRAKVLIGQGTEVVGRVDRRHWSYLMGAALVLVGIFVVLNVTKAMYHFVVNFSPKDILFDTVGEELLKDGNGYTNILLLGDGGHLRDGADLIDTIMVASIDYKKNAVSLLSIPRDFYVKTEGGTKFPGRINELYRNHKHQMSEEERFDLFTAVTGEIVGLDIQYYMRVDFNAFVEIVDSLGGIEVDVKTAIYDPYYPNDTDDGYTVFRVDAGLQEMTGETALKFVRSRKTTSDFDRAARQQQVLSALQQKALSLDVLTSPKTLQEVYEAVQKNINTNLTLREMISLAGFARKWDRSHMVAKVLHDDPGQDGGFLYTPERQYYHGQFVLIPFGDNLDLIHKYADLIFNHREAFYTPPTIDILNATKLSGIARNAAYQLNRFGFNVQSIDNYLDASGEKAYRPDSIILYNRFEEDEDGTVTTPHQSTLDALQGFVKGFASSGNPLSEYEISIVMGDDYEVFLVK